MELSLSGRAAYLLGLDPEQLVSILLERGSRLLSVVYRSLFCFLMFTLCRLQPGPDAGAPRLHYA
jgi:hypothetical protein